MAASRLSCQLVIFWLIFNNISEEFMIKLTGYHASLLSRSVISVYE